MPVSASLVACNLCTLVGEWRHNDLGVTLVPCPWRERKPLGVGWHSSSWLLLCVLCGFLVVCFVVCQFCVELIVELST